jgi:hypothetical protein
MCGMRWQLSVHYKLHATWEVSYHYTTNVKEKSDNHLFYAQFWELEFGYGSIGFSSSYDQFDTQLNKVYSLLSKRIFKKSSES